MWKTVDEGLSWRVLGLDLERLWGWTKHLWTDSPIAGT